MGTLLALQHHLVTETCCSCGIEFAMPQDYYNKCRENTDKWFHCPNGHRQHYSDSEVTRLKRELEAANSRLEYQKARAERTDKLLSASKGVITKLKRRAAAGVCPCCKRSFVNMQRHMANQHPDFAAEK